MASARIRRERDPAAEARLDAAIARRAAGENLGIRIDGKGPVIRGLTARDALLALRARSREGLPIRCEEDAQNPGVFNVMIESSEG